MITIDTESVQAFRVVAAFSLTFLHAASGAVAQEIPTRRLATPRAELAIPFSQVSSIRELTDGTVLVVDHREATVKLVDFRAQVLRPVGRTGAGAGEYRWPSKLVPLPGDTTLLLDLDGDRLLIILPGGKMGGYYDPSSAWSKSLPAVYRRFVVRFTDSHGRLYSGAPPIRLGANGSLRMIDTAAIERPETISAGRQHLVAAPAIAGIRCVGSLGRSARWTRRSRVP